MAGRQESPCENRKLSVILAFLLVKFFSSGDAAAPPRQTVLGFNVSAAGKLSSLSNGKLLANILHVMLVSEAKTSHNVRKWTDPHVPAARFLCCPLGHPGPLLSGSTAQQVTFRPALTGQFVGCHENKAVCTSCQTAGQLFQLILCLIT